MDDLETPTPRASLTRRRLIAGGGLAAAALPVLHATIPHRGLHDALGGSAADAAQPHGGHDGNRAAVTGSGHGAGNPHGAAFRKGRQVDHKANGFNPTEVLRDFDYGTTSTLPDGRTLREWTITAVDKDVEVAPGVTFAAWTFNGRIPGPTLRCTEGDRLRITFNNGSVHPHTIHFHGIHPAEMDGVPGVGAGEIAPGRSTVYEFDAEPFGLHLYHCHVHPLAEHIAKGLHGTFIIDPKQGREKADELVMVMNAFDTNFDFSNEIYAVNTIGFHFTEEPIKVSKGELIRIYLLNMLEYDPINSFHQHANFFEWYPTGTKLEPVEFTDTVVLGQGQRGILEMRFKYPGRYMFHAHKTEFADLGWMGFFEVED